MNIHLHKIAFLLVGFLACRGMYSQSDTLVITLQDSVLMANLHAQLTLTPEQTKIIDRIIAKDSEEIENLDQEHRRLARTEVQSDERDQKMAELRERKKITQRNARTKSSIGHDSRSMEHLSGKN
ncbi:MAG: hypothetical protein IPP69_04785 [Flavobacteriales bacterium]|nr:hypothetical protein [Flavobacteriales bacterium]